MIRMETFLIWDQNRTHKNYKSTHTSKEDSVYLSGEHKKGKSSGKGKSGNGRFKVSKNNGTATSKRGKSLNL